MKKLVGLFLGISMLAALTGCGSKDVISNEFLSIKQYEGLEVKAAEPAEVTDEDIDASIAYTLQVIAAEHGIKDRAAVDGDTVIIDYEGKKDGVAFAGGTATEQPLTLGSDTFIDGFEDAIIGHTPGETFDINVTFPENYGNEELNGQPVVFTIKFHAIVPTELTDELATAIVGAETTADAYRETVKEDLAVSNEATAETEYKNNVYSAFLSKCDMKKYPEDKLNACMENVEAQYGMYASYYGMETDEYLKAAYGVTCEDIAKEQVCFEAAVELVAETENITLSLEEYDETLAAQAANYGYDSAEEYEKAYDEAYGEGALQTYFLQEKVLQWLVENSKTVE